MKSLIIILFLVPCALFSQENVIEKSFDYTKDKKIDLNLKFADNITITNSDNNKIYFKATININDGKLNHAHEMDIDDSNYELEIDTDLDQDIIEDSEFVKSDDDCDHYYNSKCYNVCAKINYELRIPKEASLNLETISGDIEIKGLKGPMKIKSISGFIDLAWGNLGADMKMKTITGEVYSDLDFEIDDYDNESIVGSNMRAQYMGGGVPVRIETISSDIFVRKE